MCEIDCKPIWMVFGNEVEQLNVEKVMQNIPGRLALNIPGRLSRNMVLN